MIPKGLNDVTLNDIRALVENAVPEGRHIEYKLEPPASNADSKKEFLADISSFANADGGDLLLGVEAPDGIPTEVPGFSSPSLDDLLLRLENLIRDGIAPRVKVQLKTLSDEDRHVVLLRISKSWNRPHRVVFAGHDKFYSRSSVGKYPLDVEQLREAFTGSQTVAAQMKSFVAQRCSTVLENQGFISGASTGKLILHLIPVDDFSSHQVYDVFTIQPAELPPIGVNGWNEMINFEGLLTYQNSERTPSYAYTQLYRNATIEAVTTGVFLPFDPNDRFFYAHDIEKQILTILPTYLSVYRKLSVSPPICIYISFVGIRGYPIMMNYRNYGARPGRLLDRDDLTLPAQLLEDLNFDLPKLLRSQFDLMWNAFGVRQSPSYDEHG